MLAAMKEADQCIEMPAIGGDFNQVRVGRPHGPGKIVPALRGGRLVRSANTGIRRIDGCRFAGLDIGHFHQSDVRERLFEQIADRNGDEVVPPANPAQRAFITGIGKIAEHEHHRAAPLGPHERVEADAEVGAAAGRLEKQNVAQEPLAMPSAFPRRDVMLDAVADDQQSDAIVVAEGGESQDRGELGDDRPLGQAAAAEIEAGTAVHHKQHGEFALFNEPLQERLAEPGGDFPVDRAHIVAGLIGANVGESQPGPLERAGIRAAEQRFHRAAGAKLQSTNVPADFGGKHQFSVPVCAARLVPCPVLMVL